MTKDQFVERHRHKLGGMILDGLVCSAKGDELSMRIRSLLRGVDQLLAQMYSELCPEPKENGQAKPPAQAPARKT